MSDSATPNKANRRKFPHQPREIDDQDAEHVRQDSAELANQVPSGQYGPTAEYGAQYMVKATPWTHGYERDIVGVGMTQTFDEDGTDAETMVREYRTWCWISRPTASTSGSSIRNDHRRGPVAYGG
jgi:hypothetical protein